MGATLSTVVVPGTHSAWRRILCLLSLNSGSKKHGRRPPAIAGLTTSRLFASLPRRNAAGYALGAGSRRGCGRGRFFLWGDGPFDTAGGFPGGELHGVVLVDLAEDRIELLHGEHAGFAQGVETRGAADVGGAAVVLALGGGFELGDQREQIGVDGGRRALRRDVVIAEDK